MSRLALRAVREFGCTAVAVVFLISMFLWVGIAHATVSSNGATSLTVSGHTIKASSAPIAIISFNLAGDQTLASTSIAFQAVSGFSTTTDLAALSSATSSGVAIYRDNKVGGTRGSFDSTDAVIPLFMASTSWSGSATNATSTLTFINPEVVPADDTSFINEGADYFIVIQTVNPAGFDGHSFIVNMYPGSIGWTGVPPAGPIAFSTNVITGDTTAPLVNTSTTGPANNSTGVPVSTFVHMGFNENLDQSTLNLNNITFTQNGTAVGAAIRPYPNGFDVISSSPPTYAAASRFAKAATTTTGFFSVSGTNPISVQGAYTSPNIGDIVYTQTDTFPPEVGVVTSNTLVSGSFKINNFALFRPSQVTRFASSTVAGQIAAAAQTGVGDLIVANISLNPADMRYNWHMVTTAAAINNASLRLDGAGGAPTYATTTFARLMPAATSTIDGSTQLNATTTFSAGDLVFAKLASGGDTLGSYAWHLVTAAETVNGLLGTGATAGTTTLLRLDSAATAPTFAASSVVAKVTSATEGALDAGAQNTTSFAIGDLMFAKATANASNLGSYNFHLVSNPATGATSTNLRLDNASGNLNPSTTYVVTATPNVKDFAGNALAAASTLTFTTGSTGSTNITPPAIQSSQPQSGNQSFPPNGKLKLVFSVAMQSDGGIHAVNNTTVVKLSNAANGAPVTATSTSIAYDANTNTITVTPTNALPLNTDMVLQVLTTAQSTTNIALPQEYRLYFRTASSTDTTAPMVLGVNPTASSTGISLSQIFTAGFSKDMDPSTITGTTVKLLAQIGGASIAGNVSYSPQQRSLVFAPSTALSGATGYTFQIGAGMTGPADLSGNRLVATSTIFATTTATTDTTKPTVSFASADNFGVAITYSETVRTGGSPDAADNIANYTLESPVGTTISLGGKTVTYDAMTKTARISGLSLTSTSQFKVTVGTNVQDLAGNSIDTTGTPAGNLAFGSVQSSSATGGNLGPGTGTINFGMQGMNPTRVTPMNRGAGATSNYKVEFLAGTSVPATGQIVLTFPQGFNVSGAAAVAVANSFCNTDMNGSATGAPTISSVVGDNNAGTVTITTQTDATSANTFVCLDLSGIVNSTVPSSSGYSVDIKTRDTIANNRIVLETKTASPFLLGAAGTRTLTVNVFNDGNGNGTINDNEGLGNVRVFLFSPAIGGNSATTSASGVATFGSLADGDYMVGVDPSSVATASSTVSFNSAPQPFTVSATNLTKNFIVSGAGSTYTISGTVLGPSGTAVDVFAASNNGFSKKTITLASGAVTYSLPVAANTTYQVGVGPAMPEAFFTPGAPPPPPPTFNFMPPPNISVVIGTSSVVGKNFTLSLANSRITGTVLDKNGSAVSNAGVFARPVSTSTTNTSSTNGFGTGAMTKADGSFTINVTPGTYLVGAAKPGMPSVSDQQIVVPSSGSNSPASLAFTIGVGSTLTISGTVKDDSGNAIPYAGVSARKVNSTSDTTAIGGSEGNFVGGPTDANGAYTLYVTNGTWIIEAFGPGFGKLGSKTVTVSGSSLSGQDFSAQTLTLGTITGTTTKDGATQQGVIVRAEGSSGANMTVSDSSGVYTLKVPVGTGYTVYCVFPGVGESSPVSGVTVTANTTTYNNNCTLAAPITVTVQLTDGTNPITGAFVDARNSSGRGNNTGTYTTSGANAIYTLTLPPGTYTVRAGHPSYGMIGSTANVSSAQTITYTATAGQLYTITGSVTDGNGSALSSAWVSLFGTPTGQTNTVNMGAQTDSNGAYSIKAPPGTYSLRADKPGYISGDPPRVTVTNANKAADTITLTAASLTISGSVTLAGTGVSGAFVDASDESNGFAVTQTDSNGAYSLAVRNGTWTIHAHSIGYEGSETVRVSGASQSKSVALSAISGFTVYPEKQETVTPTAGGLLTNSDIGSAFKVNIPANALGTGSNAGTVSTQINTGVPNTSNGTVLSKNAVTISAIDSGGSPVKTLNDSVTIVIPYTESDLPSGTSESSLQIGVWNDSSQTYDMLPTTVDTTNNTLTTTVSHFSDFAPIAASAAVAVTTSSSGSTSSSGGGGGGGGAPGSVINAAPKPRAQIVYPDGRIVYVDQLQEGPAATAQNAPTVTASGSVSVSARFNAPLKHGSRGADVMRLQKLLGVEPTGYFGALTRAAVEQFQIAHGIAKKGDAGFGTLGPATRAKIAIVFASSVVAATPAQTPSAGSVAIFSGGNFIRALSLRVKGDDVRQLQAILNSNPDTQVAATGDGSAGKETDFFGAATLRAVQKFQEKYGIATRGDSGFGHVGPKTRAKLNALAESMRATKAPSPAVAPIQPTLNATSTTASNTTTVTAVIAASSTATTTSGY